MNLLAELEGRSGENLTTAVLRMLLLRSQEIREEFLRLISAQSRVGPLAIDNLSHFACILEQPTEEPGSTAWGRLDLLLETSDTVIGLENKLLAGFQEGQPQKYLETVKNHAARLSEIRRASIPLHNIVAVVAPESRSREVADRIGDNQQLLSISWEDVLKVFNPLADLMDRDTAVLLRSLDAFIRDRVAFLPRFKDWVPHLRRRFDPNGVQNDLVHRLWEFFPYAGSRLSSGPTWLGYYFPVELEGLKGWFGFIPGDESEILDGRRHGAELIVATSFEIRLPDPPFRQIRLRVGPGFLGLKPKDPIFTWAVDYDATWTTPELWRTALDPVRQQIEQRAQEAIAAMGKQAAP